MSQELQSIRCKNCEAQIDLSTARNGVVYCPRCRSAFTVAKSTDKSAVSQLTIAESLLDGGEFDRAFDAYKKASEIDGGEPQAYFGMALAEFKVQYLKDMVNDRLQPICHEMTGKRFVDSAHYKQALAAATEAQRNTYSAKAAEIDRIRDEFYKLKQQGTKYDCFICVKVTGEEVGADGRAIKTRDSDEAHRLHEYLLKHGHSPFFSERDIMNRTGADYEALILYALVSSSCMIVVCSNEDYLKTKWVKNEYTRFIRLINNDEKADDSITIAWRGSPIERLPGRNGKIQGVDLDDRDAFERLKTFVEAHAQFDMPTISRRTYGEVSLSKKTAIRSSVQKRTLRSYVKSEVPVSEQTKLALAKELLDDGAFGAVVGMCDAILSANESCADAYYYKFLAHNKCRSANEFVTCKNAATEFDTFEAAIATATEEKSKDYYALLRDKISNTKDFELYKEFISLPDSDEKDIAALTEVFYNDIIDCSDSGSQYVQPRLERFDTIIKTVTDTDAFVKMNKGVADWLWHKLELPDKAERYMAAALDADETDGDCRYDRFVLKRKLTADGDLDKFLLDKSNRDDIERELFDYGFNERAAQAMFRACLRSAETSPELGAELCGYMLSVIPPEREKMFVSFLEKYVYALIKASKFGLAKSFNEKLLAADKLDHDAYFMNVLINHKYDNPFLLIRDRNDLYGDADYNAAMYAYAERFAGSNNAYRLIVQNMKGLSDDEAQKILDAVDGNVLISGGAENFLNALFEIVNRKSKKIDEFNRNLMLYNEGVSIFEINVESANAAIWEWIEQKLKAKGLSLDDCKKAYESEYSRTAESVIADAKSKEEYYSPDKDHSYADSLVYLTNSFLRALSKNDKIGQTQMVGIVHFYIAVNSGDRMLINEISNGLSNDSELYGLVQNLSDAITALEERIAELNRNGISKQTGKPPRIEDYLITDQFARSAIGREKDRQREEQLRQKNEREAQERREREAREEAERREREAKEAKEKEERERIDAAERKRAVAILRSKRTALAALFFVLALVFALAAPTFGGALLGLRLDIPFVYVVGSFLTGLFLIPAILTTKNKYKSEYRIRRGFAAGVWFGFFAAIMCFAVMLLLQFVGVSIFFSKAHKVVCIIFAIFMFVYSLASLFVAIAYLVDGRMVDTYCCMNFRCILFGLFSMTPIFNLMIVWGGITDDFDGGDERTMSIIQIVETCIGMIAALVFCIFLV